MLIPDQVDILPDHYDANCDSRIGAQRGRGCRSMYIIIIQERLYSVHRCTCMYGHEEQQLGYARVLYY